MAKAIDWDSRIGRRIRLRDLHIFFAVVQHGSMAKAGAHLHMTQPAVSQAVATIEHTLGVRLLDRTRRGVEPTIYGSALLRRGQAAFDELRIGVNEIEGLAEPGTGEVRIACGEVFTAGVLPQIIGRVFQRYPRIRLDVTDVANAGDYSRLLQRKIDLQLSLLVQPLEREIAKDFDTEILYHDHFCLAVGAQSPWARRRKIDLPELMKEKFIMPAFGAPGPAAVKAAFGRLLGLDRAPEVKTLRRRLTRLAAHHCAEQLGAELARLRVDQRGHLMGFLYVDGHVRAYHGQRAISSNAYVARRHLAMPASTDYWINDRSGDPLLVVTGEVDAALTKALPQLLREVRDLVGERRVTIVFDRGGWSPKLFATMIKDGFDLLTYRKGRCRRIHERRFIRRHAELDGCWVDYLLHDQPVRFLKGKLRLRQVTRLCDSGHQTHVITSRCDLRDIEVAYRMFERWRQENFL